MNNTTGLDCKEAVALELLRECRNTLQGNPYKPKILDIKEILELYKACLDTVYNREFNIPDFKN